MPTRLLTFNVHNPVLGPDIDRLVRFFRQSSADIIALSECGREAFDALATALDSKGSAYAPAPFWGNGLLSLSVPLHPLESITMTPLRSGEDRSAALADAVIHGVTIRLAATHLAHGSEEERRHQLGQLVTHPTLDFGSSILLGDLNALTRSDHTECRWEAITEQRRRAGISAPRFEFMNWLRGELGFSDAIQASATPDGDAETTSRFGTRVDYILRGRTCAARWIAGSYRIISARADNISDHEAVAVDIEIASAS